jgi:hypothetical protein
LLGNNSVLDPPDPIPNSEVKWNCADDSVGSPHVKVGHCQALIPKTPYHYWCGVFFWKFVSYEDCRGLVLTKIGEGKLTPPIIELNGRVSIEVKLKPLNKRE